jgi:hypothetical protein
MNDVNGSDLDPARWGIKEAPPPRDGQDNKRNVGARVPTPVATEWGDHVALVAETNGITKGNAAAAGLIIATKHLDEWNAMAAKIGGSPPASLASGPTPS